VKRCRGFHLFPFQITLTQPLLQRLDAFGSVFGFLFINIGASCLK
jgi:hypothetical protein